MKQKALQIFWAGVESVLPEKRIKSQLKHEGGRLDITGGSTYVLAFGKAAAFMAKETEDLIGDRIADGHVVTKYGHGTELKQLTLTEAGHPIPDLQGIKATRKILDIARKAGENDLVICLISGGASALLADYPEGSSLEDLKRINNLLIRCGADISEINTVRKHLSAVKGGQLARAAAPAKVVSLILSDVIGDSLDVIASGPTAPDSSTFADALAVIRKYALEEQFPTPMLTHLHRGKEGLIPETPKPKDPLFINVQNHIIGNNRLALEAAARNAGELGFEPYIITDHMEGDYTLVADFILKTIDQFLQKNHTKPICLLFGGEPTVKVSGSGLGGRNQHLALYLATKICGKKNITILCAGTDGTDGPTDAAGAVIDNETVQKAQEKRMDASDHLSRFDSYHFFKQAGGHIITGNTGTNVMDMVVVLI